MMDAVTKEDTLSIHYKILEIIAFTVSLIGIQHGLNGFADAEVVLKVLVGEDIATAFSGLTQ